MKKFLQLFLFFITLNLYAHDEKVQVGNISLTKEKDKYVVNFDIKNHNRKLIKEARLELYINNKLILYKNIQNVSKLYSSYQLSFALENISSASDVIQLRVAKINGENVTTNSLEVPQIDTTNKLLSPLQYDDVGTYELFADAPWRMNINNSSGVKNNIPILLMCHDADLIYPLYPYIRYVDISIKKSTDANFGSILTYSGLTNANYQLLFTNKSTANATLNRKSFDQSVPTKSTTHTIEFREVAPTFFTNYYYTPVNKFLWYATFNIPASALSSFTDNDHLDVRVKFSYDGSSSVTSYLRIYRFPNGMPSITNWYRGDSHLHSIYTQNTAEQGLPLPNTKEAAKLIGLDWITTTDHTSDFDNYGTGNINDNWSMLGTEVNSLNSADPSMMYIRGQEVSLKNSDEKVVHFLGYPSYADPLNGIFLGDGNGDVTATSVTVDAALNNLKNTNGFCYAAHPFATNDELSPAVNGGIWNLGDDDFNTNGSTFPNVGGSIICNDPSKASDVLINNGNSTTKFVKDALKGGQIWNERVSMSTTDAPEDPYNLSGTHVPFSAVPNDFSFHWNRFNQGLEVIKFINKKGLLLKNSYDTIKNWKFYISAGADAHGSFNYSNTNFIESIVGNLGGSVQNNAVGKLNIIAYSASGMGANGGNILKSMHDGNISISDGPLIVQGMSLDGNNTSNEVTMGMDIAVSTADTANLFMNMQYASTTEFGTISTVNLILGTIAGETSVNVPVTGTSKSLSISNIISLFGASNVPLNQYFYLRQSITTTRNYGPNTPYIINSETFHSLTNPIWLKINSNNPLPVELTRFELEIIDNASVVLHWETASEQNNKGFEVQRSLNTTDWETIGWVDGNGNSNTNHVYTYIDNAPFSGTNYYRLKQVDIDDKFEFSKILLANLNPHKDLIFFPNPVVDNLYISSTKDIKQILVYDNTGKCVMNTSLVDNNIDLSILSRGIYFIEIKASDNESIGEKIKILKL
jgi:hypothetical protein